MLDGRPSRRRGGAARRVPPEVRGSVIRTDRAGAVAAATTDSTSWSRSACAETAGSGGGPRPGGGARSTSPASRSTRHGPVREQRQVAADGTSVCRPDWCGAGQVLERAGDVGCAEDGGGFGSPGVDHLLQRPAALASPGARSGWPVGRDACRVDGGGLAAMVAAEAGQELLVLLLDPVPPLRERLQELGGHADDLPHRALPGRTHPVKGVRSANSTPRRVCGVRPRSGCCSAPRPTPRRRRGCGRRADRHFPSGPCTLFEIATWVWRSGSPARESQ